MFRDEALERHFLTSPTIKSTARIIADWNLNNTDNIKLIGNYRLRPSEGISAKYGSLPTSFDENDEGYFYTNATNSDIVMDGGIDDLGTPTLLLQPNDKEKLLFSLEDCFGRFRPRSGINKARYGITKYLHHSHPDLASRPRYYMADKNDKFKYWTSYRNENGIEYGIANKTSSTGEYYIDDASPFVVYHQPLAANRIVVKMQTNVGSVDLSPFSNISGDTTDPLFGDSNKTTPTEWSIDVLVSNQWQTVKTFKPSDRRLDGSAIIKSDGYVELTYGLVLPKEFANNFVDNGVISSEDARPVSANNGDAYLLKANESDLGLYYVWKNGDWTTLRPEYGWSLSDESILAPASFITNLANPESYSGNSIDNKNFRELQYISGIRVSAKKMNRDGSTFDVIEISPRIVADITDSVLSYNVSKIASDLANAGLPVGQLLASTGSLNIFDPDMAFLESNPNSIVPFESFKNMQLKIYDVIALNNTTYHLPIKTMYAETFPVFNPATRTMSLDLRDMYFYFESISAPSLLLTNVSVSYAVSTLLDYIGFSNYTFKRLENETEEVIPFFFTDSSKTIAETLQDLAIATQTAMFFDEYNNFVMMSRGYVLPSEEDRPDDFALLGSPDSVSDGIVRNAQGRGQIANIIDVSTQQDSIFNDGIINFSTKYIQKSQASIKQAYELDANKTWVYKPVLLWKASGVENPKSENEESATQNSYSLTAIPLNSNLSALVPTAVNGEVVNNIINFGEGVYWLGKYNGYFYANGEVIRFDAVEYSVPGVVSSVWINSLDEYQDYFSKVPFRGKIYPTGRVRIFSEPRYKIVNGRTVIADGPVVRHGRGQFGTPVVSHTAGVNTSWTDGTKVGGVSMNSKFIFDIFKNDQPKTVSDLSGTQEGWRQTVLQKKSAIKVLLEEINHLNKQLLATPGNSNIIATIVDIQEDIALAEFSIAEAMSNLSESLQSSTKFMEFGEASRQSKRSQTTGKIKNFMAYSYGTEGQTQANLSTNTQMLQASALLIDGASSTKPEFAPINHITYVYNNPQNTTGTANTTGSLYTHFGTRMRIVGKVSANSDAYQEAHGSMPYLTVNTDNPQDNPVISGGSGGIAGLLNSSTGEGYYFEIAALDAENVEKYNAANMFFYKVTTSNPTSASVKRYSMPQLLWRGLSSITVDGGDHAGQSRVFAQEIQTVHDLAFEYVDNSSGTRTFFLYLNGVQIATVEDELPIAAGSGVALFTRGTSKCMFENVYALAHNYSDNSSLKLSPVIASAFGKTSINVNESFSKYAISGLVQSTYLSGVGPSQPPKYNMYYEEFGTIMREAAYFNVKYDKAFPALYSRITPPLSKLKSYATSSYYGGAYDAEFLVFNTTDTVLLLDGSTGSSLEIQGIAFTQDSANELTVDEFFSKKSDFSNPELSGGLIVSSPTLFTKKYQEIKNTRITYGRKEFNLESPYIQSRDAADKLMLWLSEKVMKPRKSLGVKIFASPLIQLGDILRVSYIDDDIVQTGFSSGRFVVYQIDYSRDSNGPSMDVYLSEVV